VLKYKYQPGQIKVKCYCKFLKVEIILGREVCRISETVKGVWYHKGGETLEQIALCDVMFGEALTHLVYVITTGKT